MAWRGVAWHLSMCVLYIYIYHQQYDEKLLHAPVATSPRYCCVKSLGSPLVTMGGPVLSQEQTAKHEDPSRCHRDLPGVLWLLVDKRGKILVNGS